MLVVGGKFEGANLEIFALVLFWVIEKACEKLILSYTLCYDIYIFNIVHKELSSFYYYFLFQIRE